MQWILPKTAFYGLKLCDADLGEGKEGSLRRQMDQLTAAADLAQIEMQQLNLKPAKITERQNPATG